MNNRIALKLGLYFTAALLTFSVVIGGVFTILFRDHTVEIYKNELENRAKNISKTLIDLLSSGGTGKGQGQSAGSGYRSYIKLINEIAMADVWIVDEELELITPGQGQGGNFTYADLPENADVIIDEAMSGKTAFSESFSTYFEDPVITVGVPIINDDGSIGGVVLLHSPVIGIDSAVDKGMIILLISIAASLVIALFLSVLLSLKFTRPLNIMDNNAMKLADGDYTARNLIKRNDEIGDLAEKMDFLAEKLYISAKNNEKLENLRRDFVANVSHELKTPITVIRSSLEALLDEVVTDPVKIKDYYIQMLGESLGLQRLVSDLLDLSKLQNSDFFMEMEDVDISEVLEDAVESAKNIAPEKRLEFIYNKEAKACVIKGDSYRLRQMFMIVLDNAVKFSAKRGKIHVGLKTNNEMTATVRDEGNGIDKEDLPFIFDRFHKTKAKNNTEGTGLGLAIAKQIAQRHSIIITAVSEPGKGTEFVFIFKDHRRDEK
jgi:signal transduction histidine kinase